MDRQALLPPKLRELLLLLAILSSHRLAISQLRSAAAHLGESDLPGLSQGRAESGDQKIGSSALAAARLRHAPARSGRGSPHHSDTARPCASRNHGTLS